MRIERVAILYGVGCGRSFNRKTHKMRIERKAQDLPADVTSVFQ